MTMTFNSLRGTDIELANSDTATMDDIWFDMDTGRISYLRIRSGGWLKGEEVLIAADRLAPPDDNATFWMVNMTDDDLAAAPRWPDSGGIFADWPPIIIGPFGSTISGPLLNAQMQEAMGEDWPKTPNTSADRLTDPLQQGSEILGAPVFARDGEIGTVGNLVMEPGNWHVVTLLVERPQAQDPVEMPFDAIRHQGEKAGHLVVSGTAADYRATGAQAR